jgi:hypothetical protein
MEQDTKCIDIMVDIETLGTEAGNVILSIGACRFDRTLSAATVIDPYVYHEKISIQKQLDDGFTMNTETLLWWMNQSNAAQADLFTPDKDKQSPIKVLDGFKHYCKHWNTAMERAPILWCNTKMDVVMLEYAMTHYGVDIPWRYNGFRECKSFMAGPEYHEAQQLERGTLQESWISTEQVCLMNTMMKGQEVKHNALHDAINQTCWVLSGFKYLQTIGGISGY